MTASVICRRSILLTFLIILASCLLWAQTPTGTISGIVTDKTGAVVVGAKVTVLNTNTGISRDTVTGEEGIYTFPALPMSRYTLTVEKTGFATVKTEGLVLEVDQSLRRDVQLQVGTASQEVTVTGEAGLLKQDTSEVSQVINDKVVADLPVNGRQFWQLALLSPGVSSGPPNRAGPALGWDAIIANGQREDANVFLLDGFDNRDMDLNQDASPPDYEAIAEFAVHTNSYSAAVGSAAGAVINVQTKSGTNAFHGSVFEYFRNNVMDANNWFTNHDKLGTSPFHYNQFGGSIGGPIVRNKAFFFGEYEGLRVSSGSPFTTTVPTIDHRNGNFSDLPVQLIDPITFQPIPGNQITSVMMDPPAATLMGMLPLPTNLAAIQNNYSVLLTDTQRRDSFSMKVDDLLTAKDTLTVRFSYLNNLTDTPPAYGVVIGGPSQTGLAGTDANKRYSIHLSTVHTFNPNLLNEFRFGWNWGTRRLLNSDFNLNTSDDIGIPNITINQYTKGLTHLLFNSGGISDIGSSFAMPQYLGLVNYQFRDALTIVHGRHHIEVGGDIIRRQYNYLQMLFPRGLYVYLGLSSLLSSGQALPNADLVDFLLGAPVTVQRDYMNGAVGLRGLDFDGFFQDDIKVSQRLTINAGIRYDLFRPWVEVQDRLSNFDPATGTLIQAGGKLGRATVQTDKTNFSPRVGFSYGLRNDAKTVLRGGFGLFYYDLANGSGTLTKLTYNPPTYFLQRGPNFPLAPSLAAGFPIEPFPPLSAPAGTIMYQPYNNTTSYSEEWNLNVQQVLPADVVLEVGYVGTKGVHLPGLLDLNQPLLDAQGNEIRPYSDSITGLKTWATDFSSIYHGMQVKAERRFKNGFQFLSAYTWSKSIDDNSTGGPVPISTDSTVPQNSYDIRAERAPSAFDVRHRFTFSGIYALPSLRTATNGFIRTALGGWQLNSIFSINTGVPFTPIISSGVAGNANPMFSDPTVTDIGNMRPNLIGNPIPSGFHQSVDHWFDPTAFDWTFASQPHNVALFGNAGRNSLRAPGFSSFDISLFKTFELTEAVQMQFRAEAFDLFNHTNFDAPINTVNLPSAGQIISSEPGRVIQLALRLVF